MATISTEALPPEEWVLRIQDDLLIVGDRVMHTDERQILLKRAFRLTPLKSSDDLPVGENLESIGFTADSGYFMPIS